MAVCKSKVIIPVHLSGSNCSSHNAQSVLGNIAPEIALCVHYNTAYACHYGKMLHVGVASI